MDSKIPKKYIDFMDEIFFSDKKTRLKENQEKLGSAFLKLRYVPNAGCYTEAVYVGNERII